MIDNPRVPLNKSQKTEATVPKVSYNDKPVLGETLNLAQKDTSSTASKILGDG